ncbi:putative camp-dependent protein kinase regulatory subunit [Xylona heveae TC161]|uniref:cAMP-dependent protein kinase regulatory subunit n=1 Tax=Xylona heveae (strain CBS 132557 / TC161) TaxID=1328760 RepID=A0A164ZWC9_XYLHT|nr:putative camp-dependent protein kinase regulatory subunit [Xylona heveae TC161]KZF19617.1 putative camp-dependent protein kinase regulatory subunit [Xylona heveae TC161]
MSLPIEYTNELNTLNREILKHQPSDVLQFCANFFNRRLESQRAEFLLQHGLPKSATTTGGMAESSFPGSNPFGGAPKRGGGMGRVVEEDENNAGSPTDPSSALGEQDAVGNRDRSPPAARSANASSKLSEGFPSNYSMGRRTSVSAESLNPTASTNDWTPPFHNKTQEQLSRLKSAVASNFLFAHLDEEQSAQVLGALQEKPIPAKDIKVITQGDQGDFFYVVEKGQFDVYVNSAGALQPGPDGMGKKVTSIGPGGSFGELALMYNAPRAATVISTEAHSTLWALDRITFRRILMDSAFQRRRMYESFLEEVPLLSSLTPYERSKIADALDAQKYPPGSTIIKEGDPGEAFYIIENGEAEVFKRGTEKAVHKYKKGDYFGELALLNDAPRAASVISKTEVKVATLGKDGFQRLLGPVEGIMRRDDPSKQAAVIEESIDPLTKEAQS